MATLNPATGRFRIPPLRWGSATGARPDPVRAAVAPLLAAHRAAQPGAALPGTAEAELLRGYTVAERLHRGQLRKSGAPYITHPLAVAMILAGMGLDTTTLVAALLHDTVEDTPYTLGEVRADFGDEIAVLVDGVTKLDGRRWGDRAEAETFRKIVLSAAADLRVLVIKLADRLHNLRTLRYQPEHKRARYAQASHELLVPFADRLGVHVLKREMDDLAFQARDPRAHAATRAAVRDALGRAAGRSGPRRPGCAPRSPSTASRPACWSGRPTCTRSTSRAAATWPGCGRARRRGSCCWWTAPRPTATSRSAPCTPRCTPSPGRSATSSRCRRTTCTGRCTPG
ncbi:HD domain-containing protein [Actinomadura madurae]|uniref:HD domain-containing protein n=1 Tax=Actinomadura madurae TaxID=1993 RepID=UPI0020D208DC|nr:HD domain-containing protein [Actinomadura madurae]MCP9949316.1 HD domain-containing protein [Actinomadura madurae]